ncbi:MAG TPA: VWA domain-containing protein [bacterium]|nr:VWA domain-containing protein [bacterium]
MHVYPNRMAAATKTATEFVRALPAGAKVDLATFSTFAALIVPPTDDHDRVAAALANLRPEASTAISEGLLKAVYALPGRSGLDPAARPGDPPAAGVDPRRLPPTAVVLMSDGGNHTGTLPDTAAAMAHRLHVVVHAVGLGAPGGISPDTGGGPDAEALDEDTLKRVAAATNGTYHRAASEEQLSRSSRRCFGAAWTNPRQLSEAAENRAQRASAAFALVGRLRFAPRAQGAAAGPLLSVSLLGYGRGTSRCRPAVG